MQIKSQGFSLYLSRYNHYFIDNIIIMLLNYPHIFIIKFNFYFPHNIFSEHVFSPQIYHLNSFSYCAEISFMSQCVRVFSIDILRQNALKLPIFSTSQLKSQYTQIKCHVSLYLSACQLDMPKWHIKQRNLHKMYRFDVSMSCFLQMNVLFYCAIHFYEPVLTLFHPFYEPFCHFSTLQTTQFGHFSKVHIHLGYLCVNVIA